MHLSHGPSLSVCLFLLCLSFLAQALSYYDYCFPEDSAEQLRLEEVRHAAQCNLSLCYRQMGFGKEAVEMASQVRTPSSSLPLLPSLRPPLPPPAPSLSLLPSSPSPLPLL